MAIERTKVLEAAQQHAQEGNYEQAIAEFQRLVADDPRDVRALLKIGDLQIKMGNVPAAIATYARVAEIYTEQGIHLKAVAVYKQMLKLDPERLDVYPKLIDAYEALGLRGEALGACDQLAAYHLRDGRVPEAIAALRRASKIDPEDVQIRIKLAEALSRAGEREAAAEEFEKSGALLKAQGRMDDYLKVAERLLFHRQDDVALARELAAEYLDRGDAKRALARLQLCFKSDPRDVPTLELLARAFQTLGQAGKAVSVHREIAKIHEEAGRLDAQIATMQAILELDPSDPVAREFVEKHRRPSRTPLEEALVESATADEPEALEEELELDDEVELVELDEEEIVVEDEVVEEAVVEDEVVAAEDALSVEDAPAGALDPLTEARSFARLGLWPRVVEVLEPLVEADGQDVEARLLLADAYRELEQTDDAVDQLLAAAEITALTDPELAAEYLRQVLFLDPENVEAKLQLKGARPSLSPFEMAAHDQLDEAFADRDLDTTPPPAELDTTPPPAEVETTPPPAELDTAPPAAASLEDDFVPEGRVSFGDLEVDVELFDPISPEEFEALPSDDTQAEPAVSAHADATELEEILDEAEFFINQSLFEEARDTLREALEEHPEHPLLLERLAEIDALEAEVRASTPDAGEEPVDETFAMAERLAGDAGADPLVGGDMLDADVVFEQFKKGVAEAIDEEDSATHFDLGIAYREMGLYEDAVREFEIAGRAEARRCNAYSMAGLCHLEHGRFGHAIQAFRVALEAPIKAPGEEIGLYYELGNALELFGDDDQALAAFKRVAELDPGFRDVKARIEALGDVDAAFDDLIQKD